MYMSVVQFNQCPISDQDSHYAQSTGNIQELHQINADPKDCQKCNPSHQYSHKSQLSEHTHLLQSGTIS
jgi:hypothetical protein